MSKSRYVCGKLNGQGLRIGVVTSLFNPEITLGLEAGALQRLESMGVEPHDIIAVRVPGAFEIPLAAQTLLTRQGVDGVIALGAVIRGETSHYDTVCQAVERGCSQVALELQKPVAFGVLTTEDEAQARARAGGDHGHKGVEGAEVVVEMCNLLKELQKSGSRGLDAASKSRYNL